MPGATLDHVLRRDRLVVLAALLAVTAIATAYIVWLAVDMNIPAPATASSLPRTTLAMVQKSRYTTQ